MHADPKLGVGRVWIHLVDDSAFQGVACHARVEAADSPGVVFGDTCGGAFFLRRRGGLFIVALKNMPFRGKWLFISEEKLS